MALTQTKLILQHLIEHGSITSYEAIKLFGATRLSAIIYDLRHKYGYSIASHFEQVTTRYGHKTQIAVYRLETEKKNTE
jgi:hypothetical protein